MNGNIFPQPSYQIFLYVKTMEQYHSSPSIVIVTEEDNGVTLPLLQQHIIIAVPCLKQAIDIKKVANSMLFSRGQGKITIRTPSGLFLFFFFQKMLKTLESKHKNLISSQLSYKNKPLLYRYHYRKFFSTINVYSFLL